MRQVLSRLFRARVKLSPWQKAFSWKVKIEYQSNSKLRELRTRAFHVLHAKVQKHVVQKVCICVSRHVLVKREILPPS